MFQKRVFFVCFCFLFLFSPSELKNCVVVWSVQNPPSEVSGLLSILVHSRREGFLIIGLVLLPL